jgi:hypothetical protein
MYIASANKTIFVLVKIKGAVPASNIWDIWRLANHIRKYAIPKKLDFFEKYYIVF